MGTVVIFKSPRGGLPLGERPAKLNLQVRTIADLDGGGPVTRAHIAEAVGYRRVMTGA
jgi:predicted ATPase with chaperone activity